MLADSGIQSAPLVPKRHPARVARSEKPKAAALHALDGKFLDRWEHAALLYREFDWHQAAWTFQILADDIKAHDVQSALCRLNAALIFARLNDFPRAATILGQVTHVEEVFALNLYVRGNVEHALGRPQLAEECFSIALNNLNGRPRQYHHLGLAFNLEPALIMANIEALQAVRQGWSKHANLRALPAEGVFEAPSRPAERQPRVPAIERPASVKTLYRHMGMEFELEPSVNKVSHNPSPTRTEHHGLSSKFAVPESPRVVAQKRFPLKRPESEISVPSIPDAPKDLAKPRSRGSVELGLTALPGLGNGSVPAETASPKPVSNLSSSQVPRRDVTVIPQVQRPSVPRASSEQISSQHARPEAKSKHSRGLSGLVRQLSSYKTEGAKIQKRRGVSESSVPSAENVIDSHNPLLIRQPSMSAREARVVGDSTQHLAEVIRALPHQPDVSQSGKVEIVSTQELANFFRASNAKATSQSTSKDDLSDDRSSIYSDDEDADSSRHDSLLSEGQQQQQQPLAAPKGPPLAKVQPVTSTQEPATRPSIDSRPSLESKPSKSRSSFGHWLSSTTSTAPKSETRVEYKEIFTALPGPYASAEPPKVPAAPRTTAPTRSASRRGLTKLPRIRESSCLETAPADATLDMFWQPTAPMGMAGGGSRRSFF